VVTGDALGIRWLPDAPPEPDPLVHVEPLVFVSRDSQFRFTFLEDANQQISGMDWGNLFVLEKVPWYETVAFQRVLFGGFMLVFAIAAVAWPARALAYRLGNSLTERRPGSPRRMALLASAAATATAGLNAVLLLGLLLVLPQALDLELQFGMPPLLAALLTLPMLTTVLTVGLLLLTIPMWRNPTSSNAGKVGYSLFTAVAVCFVPFLVYWNLLGFQW
jgi:hypothetical protein